jgi:hypothetical protein
MLADNFSLIDYYSLCIRHPDVLCNMKNWYLSTINTNIYLYIYYIKLQGNIFGPDVVIVMPFRCIKNKVKIIL